MKNFLFTSESVSSGHPDKIADQISDAILDACLLVDKNARVACETLLTRGLVVLAGEVSTTGSIDYQVIARKTIQDIGYNDSSLGFDYHSCGIICSINKQSMDIANGILRAHHRYQEQGAGDQATVFGYACDETSELMPMPIMLAHQIVRILREKRQSGQIPYLRPDAKSQVTIQYDETGRPFRLHSVVVSTQHSEEADQETIHKDVKTLVTQVAPPSFIDKETLFFINPAGRFVIGGPYGDCGLTGRKIIVDTYGGMARHGGGAFSGKDPSKIDRAGAYVARYISKNIVAAKLAKRCEVQLSYAIGIPHPISINLDTFGTGTVDENLLIQVIPQVFRLTPMGIIETLNLNRPIYLQTSYEGHFGRNEPDFTWEKIDQVKALLEAVKHYTIPKK